MKYLNKNTKKIFDFDITTYENIDIEECYHIDTDQNYKIVEVWDMGVIIRREMTKYELLLTHKKCMFIFNVEWFEENYERLV